MEAEQFDKVTAKVKLRRGEGWQVKPEAEQIDGNIYRFTHAGIVEEGIYEGEIIWQPDYRNYPQGAPAWVANGDLEIVDVLESDVIE